VLSRRQSRPVERHALKAEDLPGGPRLTKRVEEAFAQRGINGGRLNHFAPAGARCASQARSPAASRPQRWTTLSLCSGWSMRSSTRGDVAGNSRHGLARLSKVVMVASTRLLGDRRPRIFLRPAGPGVAAERPRQRDVAVTERDLPSRMVLTRPWRTCSPRQFRASIGPSAGNILYSAKSDVGPTRPPSDSGMTANTMKHPPVLLPPGGCYLAPMRRSGRHARRGGCSSRW
jgi:hypothetical protein